MPYTPYPVVFAGTGDQIKILGKYIGQLEKNTSMRLSWRAEQVIVFHRFLAETGHSPDTIRATDLKDLAVRIGIKVDLMSEKQWEIVQAKMRSSLLYRLQEAEKKGLIVDERYDKTRDVSMLPWLPNTIVSCSSSMFTEALNI